jgi:hypothetical protein
MAGDQLTPTRRGTMLALALSTAGLLLTAPGALASSATTSGPFLRVTAGAGEANAITVTQTGATYTITDSAGITGCTPVSGNEVTCTGTGLGIVVILGDRDDSVILSVSSLSPGSGIAVTGGDGNDVIDGSAVLVSGSTNNSYAGFAGNDTIIGGPAADALDEYNGLASQPGDPLIPAEQILTLTSAGDDRLVTGGGNNRVNAIGGADTVEGGDGDDYINTIGLSSDRKPQDDGAVDSITCGGGFDTATLGAGDLVGADCELIGQFTSCPSGGADCEGSATVTASGGGAGSSAVAAGGKGKQTVLGKSKKTKLKAGQSKGVTIRLRSSKINRVLGKRSQAPATLDLGLTKIRNGEEVGHVKRKVRFKLKK